MNFANLIGKPLMDRPGGTRSLGVIVAAEPDGEGRVRLSMRVKGQDFTGVLQELPFFAQRDWLQVISVDADPPQALPTVLRVEAVAELEKIKERTMDRYPPPNRGHDLHQGQPGAGGADIHRS
jgi:hypothetical protein